MAKVTITIEDIEGAADGEPDVQVSTSFDPEMSQNESGDLEVTAAQAVALFAITALKNSIVPVEEEV